MTNEVAIAELKDIYQNVLDYKDVRTSRAFDMAISALESQRWIPVTERLPDEDGEYLVVVADHDDKEKSVVLDAWFNTKAYNLPFGNSDFGWTLLNEFYDLTNDLREYITHWMHRPEPPKEES